jgi:hypothetical protein
MELQTGIYVLPSADGENIQTAAADLEEAGESSAVTLTSTDVSSLVSEIDGIARLSFEGGANWTSGDSNPGTVLWPALAALYGALGGTDTWVLDGHT